MTARRVALFSDHTHGAGGGEYYTYLILGALLERYPVDLIREPERAPPDPAFLQRAFGFDLTHPDLRLKTVEDQAELRNYDLLVNLSHFRVWPPLARRNLLVVFFPQVLNHRVHDYDAILTISDYSAEAIRRHWGSNRAIVAPPTVAPGRFRRLAVEPLILSVGRFFDVDGGNTKNHPVMIDAFKSLCDRGLTGWRLVLAGAADPAHAEYLGRLETSIAGYPIEIAADVSFDVLRDLYGRAAFYWHAAGLESDGLTETPSAAEHFGISVLEAMAAGCVPIVPAIGGPAEIVRHGRDGLTCRTPHELATHTAGLIADPTAYRGLARAAVERAASFDTRGFNCRVQDIVEMLFAEPDAQADFFLRDGNHDRAETLYAEAIDRFPTTAEPYLGLAECFYRAGRRELMLAMLRRGLELPISKVAPAGVEALVSRMEAQRAQIAGVRSGASFGEDYFERGADTGVNTYTDYSGDDFAARHAEAIDSTFQPGSCLDVGCAKGDLVGALRRRGVACIGTDLSVYSAGVAAPELRGTALTTASIARLPFPDDAFDLVVAIEVLEHVPAELVEPALRELWRVSRHHVFVTVQNTTAARPDKFFADLTHVTMQSLGWWRDQFERAGFVIRPIELPLGEFTDHQIVGRPRGKFVSMPPAAVETRYQALQREAQTHMHAERWDGAGRVQAQALALLDHLQEEGGAVDRWKSRVYMQMARCAAARGRDDEARGLLMMARSPELDRAA
jgi:glycosyltransferase involved in cell wall biosynthesis/predicted TPR repeat methyltransferase